MKFNDLFKSRRNIYFSVLIMTVLLLAGGMWQYRNYLNYRMQLEEMQENLNKLSEESWVNEPEFDSVADITNDDIQGLEDNKDTIKEVSNVEPKVVKTETTESNNKSTENDKAISAIKIQENKIDTMIIPVFGTISNEFSDTALVYSKTLEQWCIHTGIDIKADEGSQVRAAMDGIIYDISNDSQWGMTIVIDHGNDTYTKYCNLSTLELVSVGQKIKKGDVISGIGKTALYEIADEPHLHFEVIKGDKSINPKNHLPKQSFKR